MGKIYSLLLGLLLIGANHLHAQTTIATDTVVPTSTCPGALMIVPFTVTNPNFNPGNRFYAEWSNPFGNFDNPDTLGSTEFLFGNRGVIITSIPNDAGFGLLYRVRVVASDPEIIGTQSILPIFVTAINFTADITADPTEPQCPGEEVTLTAGLGVAGTFAWNTGDSTGSIVVTEPGNYAVTVTALGCDVASDPFTLEMLPRPDQPEIEVLGTGQLQTDPQNSLQWYLNGNPLPTTNSTLHNPTQTGQYSVIATDTNGCQSFPSTSIFHLNQSGTTIVEEFKPFRDTVITWSPEEINPDTSTATTPLPPTFTDYSLKIYPNPTADILHIEKNFLYEDFIHFKLYDRFGKEMYRSARNRVLGYYHAEVNLLRFPAGIYSLHLFIRGQLRVINIYKQ
ncbi:MAG: hypothetical protein AAF998_18615 [Bacteroidota bacterium]